MLNSEGEMRARADEELRWLTRSGITREQRAGVERRLEDWLYNTYSNAKDYALRVSLGFTGDWSVSITRRSHD